MAHAVGEGRELHVVDFQPATHRTGGRHGYGAGEGPVQHELRALADYGASLTELLEHLDEQNGTLGSSGFSSDQEEELQLYCWALNNCKSNGFGAGLPERPRR